MAMLDQGLKRMIQVAPERFVQLAAVFIARERGNELALNLLRRWFMVSQIIEESPLYQEWIAEAQARGLAEGRAEGRAKGEAEGLIEALQLFLEARFGPLNADLLAAMRQAEIEALRAAIAQAPSESLAQMHARFGLPT